MNLRLLGAICIIISCSSFGFLHAARYKKEEQTLHHMVYLLDYMECELQYHRTPLPELCQKAAIEANGVLKTIFLFLNHELENQISPDVQHCMYAALHRAQHIPKFTYKALELLGKSLGRFDLDGQIKGLDMVRQHCCINLTHLDKNRDLHTRGYQTLGLCAGAALAILLV